MSSIVASKIALPSLLMPFVDNVRVTPACRNTRFGGASVVKHIVIKLTLSDVFIFMASSTCNVMQHMPKLSTSAGVYCYSSSSRSHRDVQYSRSYTIALYVCTLSRSCCMELLQASPVADYRSEDHCAL